MLIINLLAAVMSSCMFVNAQDDGITASAPSVVSTNKAFNYSINASTQGKVSLGKIEGIRVISGPSQMVSYQSSNVNGRLTTTMQVSYSYMMVAENVGEYTIPPATLTADDKTFKSNPVTVKVVAGAAQARPGQGQGNENKSTEPDPVILRLLASDTDLYEGEQLVVSTKVAVRSRIESPSLNSPSFEGFWVESLESNQVARNEVIDGYNYNTQIVRRDLLTAQRKGEITIDPATLDVTILKRTQRRRSAFDDFFNDPMFSDPFDRYERETRVVRSNPLKIRVKPLPSGAPEEFDGAVGNFNIKSIFKEDSVQTNNAVSLVLEITGKGNLNLIDAPEIDFPPDLETFEPKKTETLDHNRGGTEGKIRFEYVIIPRHNGSYRISPIEIAWFNPDRERYENFSSSEFRFIAYGGDASGSATGGPQSGFFREDVRDIQRDIRFIKLDPGKLVPSASFLILQPWVYVYILGGIVLLVLALVLWRNKLRKESDVYYVRNKKARKVAQKRLKNARRLMEGSSDDFYEEILKAFWGYLGDRIGINTADLSKDRIEDELVKREINDKLRNNLWEVVDECEYSRYSPESSGSKEQLFEKAVNCMQEIEQKI